MTTWERSQLLARRFLFHRVIRTYWKEIHTEETIIVSDTRVKCIQHSLEQGCPPWILMK